VSEDLPRVVHLASGREWRGGQRQVLLLARELAALGVPQVVVTRADSRLHRELAAAGIAVAPVAWPRAFSAPAVRAAWRAARRRPALLHAHDGHALTIAGLAGLLAGRPWVATKRTEFPLRRPVFWRRAARVLAVSGAVARAVERGGVAAGRIAVVPSGIDVAATATVRPGSVRQALGLPAEAPLAVNVAALSAEKDHDTLLDAAARVAGPAPGVHWAIAGDGPLRAHLERRARELGLAGRVHFTGWLDDPLPLMAAATVFVLTSRAEGLGTVLLDAMALGIPVVATSAGGIPEAVGEAGLLAPPGDPDAVAGAVVQVVQDPALRARLGAAAAARVRDRDAAGMARAVLAVYRSVVQ
jgi:L-malate glycosyltransferase